MRLAKTTVYVTHDQIEAMTLASRIVIFDKGRIQQVGAPSTVFNEPASLFVAGFIGTPTMNFFKVVAAPGGRLQGDGFSLPAPGWLGQRPPAAGQALTAGIRPQALRAVPSEGRADLTLDIDVVEYLGTESQVVGHIDMPGGQRVSAMVPGDAHALLHGKLALQVDAGSVHVFDSASGRSLRT
jgi:ABC-type sugar transport system ATPase subunit